MKNGDWRINRSPSMLPKNKRERYKLIRSKVLAYLGNKCVKCSFKDHRALQIDHVKGGGAKECKKYSGVSYLYNVLKKINSGKYQILCANCNWIKRYESEEIKLKYKDNHKFPTEKPHVRVFKMKKCFQCHKRFRPKNGRQIFCTKKCVKG